MKTVVIAEKPSAAREIAFALGLSDRRDGFYLCQNNHVVTFSYGHLFEIKNPEDMNPAWKEWQLSNLPMIPASFEYQPIQSAIKQWQTVRELLQQPDTVKVINACDAGREGELIFWLIYNHAQIEKPVFRLWTSSLTRDEILNGFRNLKAASDYDGLRKAAFLRQEADWLLGINPTRAQTIVARTYGAEGVYSLGRVQTPTLTMVVERDLQIKNHQAVPFYQIQATYLDKSSGVVFKARKCTETGKVKIYANRAECSADFSDFNQVKHSSVVQRIERKTVSIKPALFFDSTLIQREMNRRHSFKAAETLEVLQSLYEKKLITYPRTSSKYLSSTVSENNVPRVLKMLQESSVYGEFAEKIISHELRLTKRYVDDAKVTDHYALIPTDSAFNSNELSDREKIVFDAIVRRFLAAFYPNAEDERSAVLISAGNHLLVARGNRELFEGWRSVYSSVAPPESEGDEPAPTDAEDQKLPELTAGSELSSRDVEILEGKTKPPPHFTDDTLLLAMETCGKMIEDEEAAEKLKESGLGAAGSRSETIEKLIRQQYLARQKKNTLSATPKAHTVIQSLKATNCVLVSAELTGKWENLLQKVSDNIVSEQDFRENISKLTYQTVKVIAENSSGANFEPVNRLACPLCRKAQRDGYLKIIPGKEKRIKYLVCSLGREKCEYFSLAPPKNSYLKRLLNEKCPKCQAWLVYRESKKSTSFLSCSKNDCQGVIWLDNRNNSK